MISKGHLLSVDLFYYE